MRNQEAKNQCLDLAIRKPKATVADTAQDTRQTRSPRASCSYLLCLGRPQECLGIAAEPKAYTINRSLATQQLATITRTPKM